ncbi:MAG: PAS domain S-box protein [Chloroflexi bacterium]|nr:PAS domain S-box protein [Chloroflexota bacterium]
MHRLLKRQIKRHLGEDFVPSAGWEKFFDVISEAYQQADLDRRMLEHSLELTSEELTERNQQLQRDLQQRIVIEQALRSNQERMRQILDTSPLPVVLYDAQGAVEYINPAFEHEFGWSLSDLADQRFGFIPEDLYYQTLTLFQEAQESRAPVEFESRRTAKGGRLLDVQINLASLHDAEGQLSGTFTIVRDVTERKARQDELQRSQRQLADIIAFFPEAILVIDAEGRVIAWNQAMEKLTGVPAGKMLGRGDYAYAATFYGEARPMLIDYVNRPLEEVRQRYPSVVTEGKSLLTDDAFVPQFKGGVYLSARASALYDPQGNYVGAIEVVRDVTERRTNEKTLNEQRQFLSQVIDANPHFVYAKDRQGRFTLANRTVAETYGTSVEGLLGKTDSDFNPNLEEVAQFLRDDLEVLETGRDKFIPEEKITDAAGNVHWLQTVKRPLLDENGQPAQVLGISTDITERKIAEEDLKRRNLVLETLSAISKETRLALDFSPVLNDVARMLCEILDGTSAYLSRWDEATARIRVVAEYVSPQASPAESVSDLGEIYPLNPRQIAQEYAWLREPNAYYLAHVDDPDLPLDEREHMRQFGGKSRLEVPLVAPTGVPFGHLEVWESRRKRDFAPEEIELLQTIARQVATALSNAELFASLQSSEELRRQVVDINPNMVFAKDRQGRYTLANLAFAQALGVRGVDEVIGRTDEELGREPTRIREYEEQDRIVLEMGSEVFDPEEMNIGPDGQPRWRQTVKRPLRDREGNITQVLGVVNDITDIKRAQEGLRESEERYRVLIENSSDIITLLDAQGVMLSASPNLSQVLGFSEPELVGKTVWDLIHTDDRQAVIQTFQETLGQPGAARLVEYRIRHKDGEWRNLESLGKVVLMPGIGPRMYITSRDVTGRVTEQAAQQAAYERRGRHVRFANLMAKQIAAANDLGALYHMVVEGLCNELGFNYVQFLRYNAAANALVLLAGSGETGQRVMARGYHVQLNQGPVGRAAGQGRSVLISDVTTDSLWSPTPEVAGTKAELATPVVLGDELIGVIDVQSAEPEGIDTDLQLLLEVLSGQVAIAVEGIRLRSEMEERLRELNTLQRLSSGEVWDAFSEAGGRGAVGYAYGHGGQEPRRLTTPSETEGPSRIEPLAVRGETIGRLGISADPDRPFTDDEQNLLQQITAEVSEALERARLFEASQRSAAELAVLNEMGQAFTEALNVDSIIENIYIYAARLLDVEDFYVALHDPAGDQVSFPLVVLQSKRLTEDHEMWAAFQPRPTGSGLTGWIIQNRQSVLIENNAEEVLKRMGLPYLQAGGQTQSWMGVPMTIGERVLGVVAAQSDTRPGLYGQHHLGLLTSIASQAAIAIDNARLFTQEQQRAEQERLVRTITDKVRRGVDTQSILRIALEELGQVLGADRAVVQLGTREQLLARTPAAEPPAGGNGEGPPQPGANGTGDDTPPAGED